MPKRPYYLKKESRKLKIGGLYVIDYSAVHKPPLVAHKELVILYKVKYSVAEYAAFIIASTDPDHSGRNKHFPKNHILIANAVEVEKKDLPLYIGWSTIYTEFMDLLKEETSIKEKPMPEVKQAQDKRLTVFVPIGYDITLKHVPSEKYFDKYSSEDSTKETSDNEPPIESIVKGRVDSFGIALPKETLLYLGEKYVRCRKLKSSKNAVQDGLFSFTDKRGLNNLVGLYEMLTLIKSMDHKPKTAAKTNLNFVSKIKGIK